MQQHKPVLLEEAITGLGINPDGIYIDGTFGRGGHSRAILDRLGEQGQLIAFDKDPQAIEHAEEHFAKEPRFTIIHASFAEMEEQIQQLDLVTKVDGVLLDLGVSSPQLDEAERGFSFRREGPLDMRMDTIQGMSAAEWLNVAKEKDIAYVLKTYGEERFSKRIARAIVEEREEHPFRTTTQLAKLIATASPFREKHKDPATRSFQAIRIFINKELEDLEQGLQQAYNILKVGGRLSVISFHSLEDRIAKQFIQPQARGEDFPRGLPVTADQIKERMRKIGKATKPSQAEVAGNPRARSSVLRVAEKLL